MTRNWEFVRASKRNRAYVRRVPWCRGNPTVYQCKVRYFLGKISHDSIGQTGLVKHGSKEIPVVAHRVSEALKGKQFAPKNRKRPPEVLLNMIPVFEELGKAVESHKLWNRDVVPRLLQWQRFHEEKKKEKRKKEVAA